jgi:hypothetical protein
VSGVALDLAARPTRRPAARWPDVVREPCFTAEVPPLPMGCAVCGHPPYAHGCSSVGAHDYEVPSAEQMAERLGRYVALGLHRRRMSEAEFRRDHPCAPVPVRAADELDTGRAEETPLDGQAAAVSAETSHVEVAAELDVTMLGASESPAPARDDVRRLAAAAPHGGRRQPVLRRSPSRRLGTFASARSSKGVTRAHTPDVSRRQRSDRVFRSNRPEPVGWRRHEHPAAAEGVFG